LIAAAVAGSRGRFAGLAGIPRQALSLTNCRSVAARWRRTNRLRAQPS